jgi:undecaprenyl diphosphate synthase
MAGQENLPKHKAIIMDGNGRWANQKGLPRIAGHIQGANTVRLVVEECGRRGIKALTLYTFSTENWKRSKEEIDALMNMLKDNLGKELPSLKKNNVMFNTIGEIEGLPQDVREKIAYAKDQTRLNTGLILTLALNYGSRTEILTAIKNIAFDIVSKKLDIENITEEIFDRYLYTKDLPQIDLLIRTSGEMRLSNFLLWQLSYSEIYVTKKFWPDFTKEDLKEAIDEFSKRQRRFGGVA